MGTTELISLELINRISSLNSTATSEDLLLISSLVNTISSDRSNVIATTGLLPSALDVPEGSVFYIDDISTLVFSVGEKWKAIDGRLYRQDQSITAYSWGVNLRGELGINSATSSVSPASINTINFWETVSAGSNFSVGLIQNGGAIYAWGSNATGQLGDNTIVSASSPVTVVGGITNWSQVSAGSQHCIALTTDGVLYAWGNNNNGRLGNLATLRQSSPVPVVGGRLGWSQISAGGSHNLAIAESENKILYSWGCNMWGQLGHGAVGDKSSPATVVGGITDWSQVSAGNFHSLGITEAGIVYAWGCGTEGQLGDNSALRRSSPVTVTGGITNWSQVSAGYRYSLGIAGGIVYAWGSNSFGSLGDNSTINRSSPITVVGGITNWTRVSTGFNHTLGITAGSVLYAWGSNASGKLGDGTTIARSSPITVAGGIASWAKIAAGDGHSIAIKLD